MRLRPSPHPLPESSTQSQATSANERIEILDAFAELSDVRRAAGTRHQVPLCLALFTLAVVAGNRGFLAIGDWLNSYHQELIALFGPPKDRLPSYSTIRRVLIAQDYKQYAACLAEFFGIAPLAGETLALDGKVLRGSYQLERDNPDSAPHPAIMLVSAYIVERGLLLPPHQVDSKTNEIKALPELIKQLALKGVVFAFDAINTQKKTCELIVNSDNHYLAALKGNQPNLFKSVKANFIPQESHFELNKEHGRLEKRTVSICTQLDDIKPWPGLQTLIRVDSQRQLKKGGQLRIETETRYYIASFGESAESFARRIRGYWGVENKVHYVRDVTQGEDRSRIRMHHLPHIFTVARNFALNLYRSSGFSNMAQAQRQCQFGLDLLKHIFRMK
jgi:predicted transposase YbfD/YdcC